MKLLRWLTSSVAGLMLVSCVTINIYFPAAAAEKAADRIIEDVWGPIPKPEQPELTEPEAMQQESSRQIDQSPLAMRMLDWFVSPANAGANLNIDSPAIKAIQKKMKARHNKIKPYYASGAVGLTQKGFITVRNAKAIPLKDRNTVKNLVADENADRNALYAEIARANGHPEWKADIQSTFANRWVDRAASGWWYQSSGKWLQK